MNRLLIARIVAVLTGAAVMFALQQQLGLGLYIALPAAALAYILVKVAIGLLLGAGEKA